MGKKLKLFGLAVLGIICAVVYPTVKKNYVKYVKPHMHIVAKVYTTAKEFNILGYHIPWRYILPVFALFIAYKLYKRRKRRKQEEAERLRREQAGQRYMTEEEANKHLGELQKRLDTTERTMHLVMKQMEAVTKCLAKTLADDPALSGDKSLAEITEGLVNLKESNV